jgi:chemotaxis response regulator CheB
MGAGIGGKMTRSTSSSTNSRRAEKAAKEVREKAITMVAKEAMRRAEAKEKALKNEEEKADMRRSKARARAFKASATGAARGGTLPPSA